MELEPARPAIIQRASVIADYTDTSVFAPEVDDNGVAQPEEWFELDPAGGEDSAEEIDSSDEGEEEEEEGEDAEPAGGAADQPQPDRASSTTSRASASPATGGGQVETSWRPLLQPARPSPPTSSAPAPRPSLVCHLLFSCLVTFGTILC